MSTQDPFTRRADDSNPRLAKVGVVVWLVLSYSCLAAVVVLATASAEGVTLIEGITVDPLAFVAMFGPVAVAAALFSAMLTATQRHALSRSWYLAGLSPLLSVLPIAAFLLFKLGDF